MTFTIKIRPRSPFGTDKEEKVADAKVLAAEIEQLDGVKSTEVLESVQKSAGVLEDPVVIAALVNGTLWSPWHALPVCSSCSRTNGKRASTKQFRFRSTRPTFTWPMTLRLK
jgi:hypothetical protein